MEVLYAYLSGPEFGQRVEAVANAFGSMKKRSRPGKKGDDQDMGKKREADWPGDQ